MKSVLFFGFFLFINLSCGKKDNEIVSEKENKSIAVLTQIIKPKSFENFLVLTAEARGKEDLTLSISMGGQVKSVGEVGRKVKKGDSLCQIDSEKFSALYKQALAAKELAQTEWDRIKSHVEKGSLGKVAETKAELDYWTAEVNFQNAKKTHEESRCISPINGLIAAKYITKFQNLHPGAPTLRLVSTEEMEIIFQIPEKNGGFVQKGSKIIYFPAENGSQTNRYTGKVLYVDKAVDSRNRSFVAVALIQNQGGKILPGTVGEVRVLQNIVENAIAVPASVLLRQAGGVFVMIVENGKAKKVEVKLGASSTQEVLVLSGIEPNQELVIEGAFKLSDGMPVSTAQIPKKLLEK